MLFLHGGWDSLLSGGNQDGFAAHGHFAVAVDVGADFDVAALFDLFGYFDLYRDVAVDQDGADEFGGDRDGDAAVAREVFAQHFGYDREEHDAVDDGAVELGFLLYVGWIYVDGVVVA